MLKKVLPTLLAILLVLTFGTVARAGGAVPPTLTLSATTATEIFVGETVTFQATFTCNEYVNAWETAALQPLIGSSPSGNPVTISNPNYVRPTSVNAQLVVEPVLGQFTLTFATAGTFKVDASIDTDLVQDGSLSVQALGPCDVARASSEVTVTVKDRPTTTTTTTTTIAPTTTVKEKKVLPATGSDNNALIAVSVVLAGAAVLVSRRRLLTK